MQQKPITENPPQDTLRPRTLPIADRTRKTYLDMVATATRASIKKRTTDWDEPAPARLTDIVEDYFGREDIAASTKNTMRAAFIWLIESGETKITPDAIAALAKLKAIKSVTGRKPKEKRRTKTIPQADLTALINHLTDKAQTTQWAYRTASWIRAGLIAGARPVEWLDIEWTDETKTALRIRNAKMKLTAPAFLRRAVEEEDFSDLRESRHDQFDFWTTDDDNTEAVPTGNPPEPKYRIVPIESEADRRAIDIHLDLMRAEVLHHEEKAAREAAYTYYYGNCRKTMTRACNALWKGEKFYSLYTMRSQFSANIRAAKGVTVAAEQMGHTSPISPSRASYGKGNQAHPKFKGLRPSNQQHNEQVDLAASSPTADGSDSESSPSVE